MRLIARFLIFASDHMHITGPSRRTVPLLPLASGLYAGILHGFNDAFPFALTVLAVYLAVNVIIWHLDKKEAREINKLIKSFQNKNEQE